MITEQHQKFLKRLSNSTEAVFVVARWFYAKGYGIRIPSLHMAPTADVHKDYLDEGDLFILKDGKPERRIEVKTMRFNFAGKDDWPYAQSLVSNVAAVDRMDPIAEAFFIVSNDLKAAGYILGSTKASWVQKTLTPKTTGNPENFYSCPIDLMKFVQLQLNG